MDKNQRLRATDNWKCPDCEVVIARRCNVYRHMKNWCKGNSHAGKNGGRQKKSFNVARSEMPRVRKARNFQALSDHEAEND